MLTVYLQMQEELGCITSDVTRVITCSVPSNLPTGMDYRVRIRPTNYPMVADDSGVNLVIYSNLHTLNIPTNTTGYSFL